MKEIVLGAFEVENKPGFYNVWRYDTTSTHCVLYCVKANDASHAKNLAMTKINEKLTV